MPLTRASPCVGNLLEESESEANALMLFAASLLLGSSGPNEALQLLDGRSGLSDALRCRLCECSRRGLRAACLLRLQL